MSGYDRFAELIGRHPEYTIYRRFKTLNAKRLLYMQAELSHLEEYIALISEQDCSDTRTQSFATSWDMLNGASAEGGANLQSQTVREMSTKLDNYYNMLLQTERVLKLPSPEKSETGFLRFWLEWRQGGDCFLKGIESKPYHPSNTEDLLTLSPTARKDPFAQYLIDKFLDWYHHGASRKTKPTSNDDLGPLWDYDHSIFIWLGDIICAILSSVVPIMSICLLYYIQSMFLKLVIVTVMNFLFSFVMMFVVRGRRVDVFAASTAFAAVQVVFIGGVSYILKEH